MPTYLYIYGYIEWIKWIFGAIYDQQCSVNWRPVDVLNITKTISLIQMLIKCSTEWHVNPLSGPFNAMCCCKYTCNVMFQNQPVNTSILFCFTVLHIIIWTVDMNRTQTHTHAIIFFPWFHLNEMISFALFITSKNIHRSGCLFIHHFEYKCKAQTSKWYVVVIVVTVMSRQIIYNICN